MHNDQSGQPTRAATLCLTLALATVATVYAQPDPTTPTIHVGVVVSDMACAMDFYQGIMGLHQVDRYDLDADFGRRSGLSGGIPFIVEVLAFEDAPGGPFVKLVSFEKEPAHPAQQGIQDDTGVQYLTLEVDDLAPFLDRFAAHGVPLLGETPIPISQDRFLVLVQDPDGTFLELIGPRLAE